MTTSITRNSHSISLLDGEIVEENDFGSMRRITADNLPILTQPVQPSAAHDYSQLTTPSVWRNGRTAAAKVDALASNGMDEIEIPAFLRKQAD